ncbi:MAG: hypothetical protein WCF81_16620 [Roseiarcus sp.]
MLEFQRLVRFVVNAALNAELEHIQWTKGRSILDAGCEHLVSTSVARAAAAFYGVNNDIRIRLECPVSELTAKRSSKGRVDCAIFKGDAPLVIIECKRGLYKGIITNDIKRCCEILRAIESLNKCAILIGLRLRHEEDKTDKNESALKIAKKLAEQSPKYSFEAFSQSREFDPPIEKHIHPTTGKELTWMASLAQAILIQAT